MPAVAALAMAAGLLHIWNHALMKGLMFFAAGSVLHGTGTKDMEKLGGLMKRMPWTGSVMMVGAVAICGLPPLNGFVSEWLMYLSLMKCGLATNDGREPDGLLGGRPRLPWSGAWPRSPFVRLTGIVLLGSPRSEARRHAHESSPWMLVPMVLLVFLCLTVAVFPKDGRRLAVGYVLDQVLGAEPVKRSWGMEPSEAPLSTLGYVSTPGR